MAEEQELDLGEETKGSKKKLILIIALALVLLGGGGGAAWFFLMSDEPESEEATTAPEEQADEEDAADDEAPPIYHLFKPVFVVTLPPESKARMLQLELQVLTRQARVDEFLTLNDPMVRHHLLNLLSEQGDEILGTAEGREKLREMIIERLEQLMKENGKRGRIENVYFSQFVLQ